MLIICANPLRIRLSTKKKFWNFVERSNLAPQTILSL